MTEQIINRLYFTRNSVTILQFLRSGASVEEAALFTLNAIDPMPESLRINLTDDIRQLSLLNVSPPDLPDEILESAIQHAYGGESEKQPLEAIEKRIVSLKKSSGVDHNLLAKAEENLKQHGQISYYDWRLNHWGTLDDIQSVVSTTFVENTEFIEFSTLWTPPLVALKSLANTFPSVRFELMYRKSTSERWHKQVLFPLNPFGY